jgi:hypothetical protein
MEGEEVVLRNAGGGSGLDKTMGSYEGLKVNWRFGEMPAAGFTTRGAGPWGY